jgi:hypothetical protein
MPDPFTLFPTVLKYASKVWAFPLRLYYTKERLTSYLHLDVSASGENINYIYHSQEAYCYLEAYNLSPFDFTIDRIKIYVVLDMGVSFSFTNLAPYLIKGASHQRIFIRNQSPMTTESAQRLKESKIARVSIDAYVITSICSFQFGRDINQINNIRVTV